MLYGEIDLDSYKTIRAEALDEYIVKKSRFIGHIRPVTTQDEALSFIQEISKKHWDATHNVYAYILREGGVKRFSDDGEPQGTAGIPVLDVLEKSGVTDCAVVVTRYFGGIMLGAGGLVRAYSHSASIALEAGGIIMMQECSKCHLVCDYNRYGRISGLIPSCGGVTDDTEYGADVTLRFHIPPEKLPEFEKQLADATCGAITCEEDGKDYFIMKTT